MDDANALRAKERQAYAAYSKIREVLDGLAEDHPSVPYLLHAEQAAQQHWRALRDQFEALERAAREARD